MENKKLFYFLVTSNIIVLCITILVAIYTFGYLKDSKIEQSNQIKTLNDLINHKFKLNDRKADSLIKEFGELKITIQQQNTFSFFQDMKKELLSKIIEVSDKIDLLKVDLLKKEQVIPENSKEVSNQNTYQTLEKYFDINKLQQLSTDTKSHHFPTKQHALRIMALIGSNEQKRMVMEAIYDKEEDISLRRELIETINWNDLGSGLINLLKEKEYSELYESVIAKAEEINFYPNEKIEFENILSSLFQNQDDDLKKYILKYFSNTNKEYIQQLLNKVDKTALSPEINEYIQSIQ